MAAQHAGFALVTSIGEGLANDIIEAAFINHVAPITFQLPSPIAVGGRNISVSGAVTLHPPRVVFAARADNLILVRCRATADLRFEGATATPVDVAIELGCAFFVGLRIAVINDRFQVGLDLSQAAVDALDVKVIDGRPLVQAYAAALRSGPALAAVANALRTIPPHLLQVTLNGFPATTRIAPRQMPCGASLFELPEMFRVSFSISRVAPRVRDGRLMLGVDIAGVTNGAVDQLESLDTQRVVWVETLGAERPVEFRAVNARGSGNAQVSVNPDALDALLRGPISSGVRNAFVDCHVALEELSIGFGVFSPPLQPQFRIEGARLQVNARYYAAPGRDAQHRLTPGGVSAGASVSIPLAVHMRTYDGPTDFLSGKADQWFIRVYRPDVDLPWWISFGLALLGIAVPVLALPAITILDGILPSMLGNVANQVQRNAQAGVNGAATSFGLGPVTNPSMTFPHLPRTPGHLRTNLVSITGDGLDVHLGVGLGVAQDARPDRNLIVTVFGSAVRTGGEVRCGVVQPQPVPCAVRLKPGVVELSDAFVRVRWEVRRSDTGQVCLYKDLPYSSLIRVAPDGSAVGESSRTIVIDRLSDELMPVEEFQVYVRVYRPLYGRAKELGSCKFSIKVEDRFDRSHPYVHWEGWAAGAPKYSAIHRTSITGRCRMLNRAARKAHFIYLDALPFERDEINEHRKELCEYCFFGGPDKYTPLI